MRGKKLVLAAVAVLGLASLANAAPLGLTKTWPDMYSNFLEVEYTVSGNTGTLFVQGQPVAFQASSGGTVYDTSSPSLTDYTISTTWNLTTDQMTSGTLTVDGTLPGLPAGSPLLTGSLSAFGFPNDSGDNFEFTFTPTGGSLESYYPGVIGVSLHPEGLNTSASGAAKFSANFSNDGTGDVGDADSFATPAPEPGSIGLLLAGAAGLLWRRKRSAGKRV